MSEVKFTPEEKREIIYCLVKHALDAVRLSGSPLAVLNNSLSQWDKEDFWEELLKRAEAEYDRENCVGFDLKCMQRNWRKRDDLFAKLLSETLAEKMKGDDRGEYRRLPGRLMLLSEMGLRAFQQKLTEEIYHLIDYRRESRQQVQDLERILESLQDCHTRTRRRNQLAFLTALKYGDLGKRPGFESMEGPASHIYKFL